MNNVNPLKMAKINAQLAIIIADEFADNNTAFFKDLDTFVAKYKRKLTQRTLRSLTDAFVSVAKEKSFPLYYDNEYGVDSNIFTWPGNLTVIDGDFSQGTITRCKKNTTEKEMLKTALKLPRSQAIERMTAELTGGYFDETRKVFIIYLTDVNSDGVPLKLVGYRYHDGGLGLNVIEVYPDDTWNVDSGDRVGFLSN